MKKFIFLLIVMSTCCLSSCNIQMQRTNTQNPGEAKLVVYRERLSSFGYPVKLILCEDGTTIKISRPKIHQALIEKGDTLTIRGSKIVHISYK